MERCILDQESKIVVNRVVWEEGSSWQPPGGQEFAPQDDGQIGWRWNGIGWDKPKEPAPEMPLTQNEIIDQELASNAALRGLIRACADRFPLTTESKLVSEIKAKA